MNAALPRSNATSELRTPHLVEALSAIDYDKIKVDKNTLREAQDEAERFVKEVKFVSGHIYMPDDDRKHLTNILRSSEDLKTLAKQLDEEGASVLLSSSTLSEKLDDLRKLLVNPEIDSLRAQIEQYKLMHAEYEATKARNALMLPYYVNRLESTVELRIQVEELKEEISMLQAENAKLKSGKGEPKVDDLDEHGAYGCPSAFPDEDGTWVPSGEEKEDVTAPPADNAAGGVLLPTGIDDMEDDEMSPILEFENRVSEPPVLPKHTGMFAKLLTPVPTAPPSEMPSPPKKPTATKKRARTEEDTFKRTEEDTFKERWENWKKAFKAKYEENEREEKELKERGEPETQDKNP